MKIHELKTDPEYFDSILHDWKTLEIRFDDRFYNVGDYLLLRRTALTGKQMITGGKLSYTGKYILAKISHIQKYIGLKEGWVAISIKFLDSGEW